MSDQTKDQLIGANVARLRGSMSQKALAAAMRSRGHKWSQSTVWSVEQGDRPLRYSEAQDLLQILTGGRQVPLLEDSGDAMLRGRVGELLVSRQRLTDEITKYVSTRWDLVDLLAATPEVGEDLALDLLEVLGSPGDVDFILGVALARAGAGDPRFPERVSDESMYEDGANSAHALEDKRRLLFNVRLAKPYDWGSRYIEEQFDCDLRKYSDAELMDLGIDPGISTDRRRRRPADRAFQQLADSMLAEIASKKRSQSRRQAGDDGQ